MARPKSKNAKGERLIVRVTEQELKTIKRNAKRAKAESASAWARQRLLEVSDDAR